MKLKVLDLFSGIGGFSLGLESTGFFETIGFVEKDNFCQKVLKKHWSNINIEGDIRNVKGSEYAADVVTGGFPCQPFSVAGKRKSTADDRYLWDEMLRVIRETKPRWVIGENVEGIVNINNGMVLRQVLNDLENEGFKSQCIIIPASGIGAWHQRKRIWIIANSSSQRSSSQSIGEHRELDKEIKRKKETRYQSAFCTSSSCSDVSNSNSWLCRGWRTEFKSGDDGKWCFYSEKEKKTRENIWCETIGHNDILGEDVSNSMCKGLQGHDIMQIAREKTITNSTSKDDEIRKSWWQTESELCGVPDGVSYELDKDRSNRIKSLGNSIVPQIAREIGMAIMKAETNAI